MLILVTGASKGIGLELVRKLASKKGVLVLAISRNTEPLRKKENQFHNVLPIAADITKVSDLKKIVKVVHKLGTPVAALINNAGLLVKKGFPFITASELQQVYTTNVFAPFHLIQAMLPYLSQKSHVVNISSMGGVQGSAKFAGLSAYSSSKAALCALTECLAEELKPRQISFNCLALGAVQTEMLEAAFPGYRAPVSAKRMARYISDFALNGHRYYNGKVLPVSLSTP